MAIISELKCARCDRKYSGVRSRCPYCGARRIGRGKYSGDGDNNKGKMLICVLVLAVITVAVGALLLTTPMPEEDPLLNGSALDEPPGLNLPTDEGNNSIPGPGVPDPPEPDPAHEDPPEPLPPAIESVTITYDGNSRTDITARVGEKVPLGVRIEPAGIDVDYDITWDSDEPSFFDVVPAPGTDGLRATVTGLAVGTGTLTVRVGDVEARCIVRVTRAR